MATPAQAAAATVGAGSLAAAGAYGITQAVNGGGEETNTEEQTETDEQDLNEPTQVVTFENETAFTNYTGKLITFIKETNLAHLVKPLDSSNQKWWDWAFKNKYPKLSKGKQSHQLFQSVTSSETLKTACDSAYKAERTDYSFEANHHLLQNISDYCTKTTNSIDISEPKVVFYNDNTTPSGYNNGLLSVDSNRPKLVKSKEDNNDLWWKWAFKNVFSKSEGNKSSVFDGVNNGHSSSADATPNKYLNNACDEAYKKGYADLKTTGTTTPSLLTDIKKFCSKDKEQTELVLPEPANPTNLASNSTDYQTDKSLAKKTDNRAHLIDAKLANNQNWWEWSYTTRYSIMSETDKKALPLSFQKITKGYEAISTTVSDQSPLTLNKACSKAYDSLKGGFEGDNNGNNKLLDTVKKFCTRNVTGTTLSLPE